MSIIAGITLGIALLGAVLGIINTVHTVWRDRVRLKVTPMWMFAGGGESQMTIDIVNSGFLDVTITGAGFSEARGKGCYWIVPALLLHGGHLPQRMQPRTTITVLLPVGTEDQEWMGKVKQARVKTACGRQFEGITPALRGQINKVRAATRLGQASE